MDKLNEAIAIERKAYNELFLRVRKAVDILNGLEAMRCEEKPTVKDCPCQCWNYQPNKPAPQDDDPIEKMWKKWCNSFVISPKVEMARGQDAWQAICQYMEKKGQVTP